MPELEDQCILNHSSELLHINFRNMRQSIENEMSHLRSEIASGTKVEEAVDRISKLMATVRRAKQKHIQLMEATVHRARFWMQYQWEEPNTGPAAPVLEVLNSIGFQKSENDRDTTNNRDLPVIVPIVNYLAERGCYPNAVNRLLELRPDLLPLLDLNVIQEENDLVEKFKHKDYMSILKWCRTHRSTLRRVNCKLELQMQLKEYTRLIGQGRTREALTFGKKAFSKVNPVDSPAITDANSALFDIDKLNPPVGGIRVGIESSNSSVSSPNNESKLASPTTRSDLIKARRFISNRRNRRRNLYSDPVNDDIVSQIRYAVRQVYRRPGQNPMVNAILLGAAALKTQQCVCGSHSEELDEIDKGPTCPLCHSIKLEPLVEAVPFAHHTRSKLESDLKEFPSGAVMSLRRIRKMSDLNSPNPAAAIYLDPKTSRMVSSSKLKNVFAL